jgi:hypothetical protein
LSGVVGLVGRDAVKPVWNTTRTWKHIVFPFTESNGKLHPLGLASIIA